MITLQDLFVYLEHVLHPKTFTDMCINGVQVEGKSSIKKIGFAVSTSLESIEKGIELGIDALIVHHGLFWNKEPMQIKGAKKKRLKKLLDYDISLLAYHLPLDAHPEFGNNWKAAYDLGLKEIEMFEGIGARGKIALPIEAFVSKLESYYDHPSFVALGGKKKIETVAIVSGGAHRMLPQVIDAQIDCFVTGSFDEPIYHMAFDDNVNFIAMGHHATERVGVQTLLKRVQQDLKVDCVWIHENNPF